MQVRSSSERIPSLRVGTSEHFRWLHGIVKAVLVLNLIDALLTLVWVRSGLAHEANPLIEQLVNEHAVAFVLVKLGLVSLGSWLLWHRRERPAAVIAIVAAFLAYYLVLLYHIQYASGLLRHVFEVAQRC
jgi:glucan phosphoethanolaminetransferase (alkaline phosphatase superfamily)